MEIIDGGNEFLNCFLQRGQVVSNNLRKHFMQKECLQGVVIIKLFSIFPKQIGHSDIL